MLITVFQLNISMLLVSAPYLHHMNNLFICELFNIQLDPQRHSQVLFASYSIVRSLAPQLGVVCELFNSQILSATVRYCLGFFPFVPTFLSSKFLTTVLHYSCVCFYLLLHPCCSHARGILYVWDSLPVHGISVPYIQSVVNGLVCFCLFGSCLVVG